MGRGNHFVELQRADEDNQLWLTVHTGSRGLGRRVQEHHAGRAEQSPIGPRVRGDSDAGAALLRDLTWARGYARSNRRLILESASAVLRELVGLEPEWSASFDCEHNTVDREAHGGEQLWVHRKGANRALLDELAIIPGSMGAATYHVVGRGNRDSLCSSSHGAGRAMSRSEARQRVRAEDLDEQLDGVIYDRRAAHRLRDEAPSAYKSISQVMRAQKELVKTVRRLRPVLVYKGT